MGKAGRPRGFDRDEALEQAMEAFWRRGYEGTSLRELEHATGVRVASLYAAFGSKAELFLEALQRYDDVEGRIAADALRDEPTARAAVEAILLGNAIAYARESRPRGCLVVLGAATVPEDEPALIDALDRNRAAARDAIAARIARGIEDGDVPPEADPVTAADVFYTFLEGLALRARSGASADELTRMARAALAGWDNVITR